MSSTSVKFPQLRQQDLVTCYAQIRPQRKEGLRIQKQFTKGKNIIHNYGHGGAGFSVGPSSAAQAVSLALHLIKSEHNVAVIGSGISGMLVALEILNKNPTSKVTIYSQKLPSYCNKNNQELIVSEVAPGLWLPYRYGLKDEEMRKRFSRQSYEWYKRMSLNQLYRDYIKEVDYFDLEDENVSDSVSSYLTEELQPSLRSIKLTINGKGTFIARTFKTFKIDTQPFQFVLKSQLIQKGVQFVQQKLTSTSIFSLKEEVIFNCSGYGSKYLFGDQGMIPQKGHLVQYKNLQPNNFNYFMRINFGKRRIAYYMHSSRILIGLTVHQDESIKVNKSVIQDIKDIHRLAVQKFSSSSDPRPKL